MTGFYPSFDGPISTSPEDDRVLWTMGLLAGDESEALDFGREPRVFRHRIQDEALFNDDALAELIERTPRDHYHVNTMPHDATAPGRWREGDMAGLDGRAVMAAVAKGNIWLHLRRVQEVSGAHRDLLDSIFAEIERRSPGLRTYRRSMSVLVSSPDMNVAYHADVPGQSLWQIRGRKRVWVYPARAPFLDRAVMEKIVLHRAKDTDFHYEPGFDAHAQAFDLTPGDVATWPRNCPHRVRNADCVNVSFTTEHWSDELRAGYAVDYANGLLRPFLGGREPSRAQHGLAFRAKFALAAAHKATRRVKPVKVPRIVDFRVDPAAAAGFVDVAPFAV